MQTRDNPYFHWGPISDQEYFYGREEKINDLLQAAKKAQSVSLVGLRKAGKTSLLFHLEATLNYAGSSSEEIECVYAYLDGQAYQKTDPSVFHYDILDKICKVLTAKDKPILPREQPKDKMDHRDLGEAVSSFRRRKIRPVILVDEFDALCENQSFDHTFFTGLRSVMTRGLVFITASTRTLYQLGLDKTTISSPFFNYFRVLPIGLFRKESALKLIRDPAAKCGVCFDESVVTEILRLAGRFPFFLQQVCCIAFDMYRRRAGEFVKGDFEVLYAKSKQVLGEQMDSYWDDLTLEEQQILFRVAEDKSLEQDSQKALVELVKQDMLVQSNGGYHIFSALFKDYVRARPYPKAQHQQKWRDRFENWEKFDEGGMSVVYRAYQSALDRDVAIKELRLQTGRTDQDVDRFRWEACAIAGSDHPNILPVYDFWQEGDRAYIVMKYAAGGSLLNRLKEIQGPFDLKTAAKIIIHIGQALGYAHQQGIVHRDIKPANIFLREDGQPLLGDFGLALSRGEMPETGMTGSFDYISPEQYMGAKGIGVDHRSDIYSLGVVLYHLLVGEIPYTEETDVVQRMRKRLTEGVPSPRLRNPQVSEELERIVLQATASDPTKRYQMAEEMVEALQVYLDNVRRKDNDFVYVTTQPTTFTKPALPSATALSSSAPNTQLASILIVTVTKVEAQAVLDVFSKAAGTKWTRKVIGGKTYYNLGTHGGVPVFMVQSRMGTAAPSGALLTVRQAIQDLHPQAVIMCGIAFGLRPDKQDLGDILVAERILCYEPQRVDEERGLISRGDRVTSADRPLDRFRSGDNDWKGAHTHFGLVLSGEKLVDDPTFRDQLLKTEPEAVGGEMEGVGLYAAARDAKVDWILVKAICDWADGKKNDDAHPLAASNAAQFVLHVLQLGGWGGTEPLLAYEEKGKKPLSLGQFEHDQQSTGLIEPKPQGDSVEAVASTTSPVQDEPRPASSGGSHSVRLLISALVVMVIFASTITVLVWAVQRVSPIALAFVLVVALVFDLVSVVSMLVLVDVISREQAMDFLNAVLGKVPVLKLHLPPSKSVSEKEQ